jgi:hypothetical protein
MKTSKIMLISAVVFSFMLLLLISIENFAIAQTMTINNVTSNFFKNASGTVIIKNVGNTDNPKVLLSEATKFAPITNNTPGSSLKNQSYWWQYNIGSKFS